MKQTLTLFILSAHFTSFIHCHFFRESSPVFSRIENPFPSPVVQQQQQHHHHQKQSRSERRHSSNFYGNNVQCAAEQFSIRRQFDPTNYFASKYNPANPIIKLGVLASYKYSKVSRNCSNYSICFEKIKFLS